MTLFRADQDATPWEIGQRGKWWVTHLEQASRYRTMLGFGGPSSAPGPRTRA